MTTGSRRTLHPVLVAVLAAATLVPRSFATLAEPCEYNCAHGSGRAPADLVWSGGRGRVRLQNLVTSLTREKLPARWKMQSARLSRTILRAASRFDVDPLILVAVIDTESSFRPNARGSHGEIGLMQLKPSTAQWIARRHGLPWWGPATLLDPAANVRLGAAYLSDIRNRLELARARETNPEHQLHKLQVPLYLIAYNLGSTKLRVAMRDRSVPLEYAARVMRRYSGFHQRLRMQPHRKPGPVVASAGSARWTLPSLRLAIRSS